jgi:hypothetical protein
MSMAVRGMSDCGPSADVPGCQRHHGNMTALKTFGTPPKISGSPWYRAAKKVRDNAKVSRKR